MTTTRLQTVKEHNAAVYEALRNPKPAYTGLACDACGAETVYSDNMVMTSNPPQRRVDCPACGWQGTMVG